MTPPPPNRHQAALTRIVTEEILDHLPADHPDARASRRDLTRINSLMGNYRFLKRELIRHYQPGDQCIEIGAGSGQFSKVISPAAFPGTITGLDLAPRPQSWPAAWPWKQANLFATDTIAQSDIVLASLILHHFQDSELSLLAQSLSNARVLIITEPWRCDLAHTWGRWAERTGIHPVTRHDMHVSIDAGFRQGELPALLNLSPNEWNISECEDWRGSLRMVACKR